jgi:[calcium/calmodulin-dependent protein kinase] kinase
MSEDEEEGSLSFFLKNKEDNDGEEPQSEIEKDKKEEEEIFNRYEKIGNLTDIKSIKESELTKNYDSQGNKYYNEYKYLQILGMGAYSKVKLVMKDNVKYAMKIIDKKGLKKKKIFTQDKDGNVIVTNLLKDALKEIAILKKLDHPNIIKLYEILHNYQKEKIYLIMEYAEYGDIIDYDEDNGIFSINKHVSEMYNKNKKPNKYYLEEDILTFCKHIVLGLDYLHKNGIIHRDIKPNNILLSKKGCKLTDFNFSSILDNLNIDNIGQNADSADHFKAPETLLDLNENEETNNKESNNNNDNDKTKAFRGKPLDIWALGVTLYIMTYLKFPFDSDKGILDLYNTAKITLQTLNF